MTRARRAVTVLAAFILNFVSGCIHEAQPDQPPTSSDQEPSEPEKTEAVSPPPASATALAEILVKPNPKTRECRDARNAWMDANQALYNVGAQVAVCVLKGSNEESCKQQYQFNAAHQTKDQKWNERIQVCGK